MAQNSKTGRGKVGISFLFLLFLFSRSHFSATLKECTRATGYSPSKISRIVNSPDFQRHYRAARKIIEEEVSKSAIRRLEGGRDDA